MSFPNVIYGDYGDEKVTSSTKIGSLPLGQVMKLPNGVECVHAKASGSALVAGMLYQQNTLADVAGSADVGMQRNMAVAAGAAAGVSQVTVTLGGTAALSKDLLEDGYLFINDAIGEGHVHTIKGHDEAAAGSSCTVTLYDNDAIKVALIAGSSQVGLRQNEYHDVTLTTANTVQTGPIAGFAQVAVAANYYCWLVRRGRTAAMAQGTLVVGQQVIASQTTAGAVGPQATGTIAVIKERQTVGEVMNVPAASTEFSLIKATLP